jgi:hypothetical protein
VAQTVVFLQNAWSPFYAGRVWPRRSWLRALAASRSGKRLRLLIDDLDLCEETTPEVAATPSGVCPPDFDYIRGVIARRQPCAIVACGKQAEAALLELWPGPLLAVPHPAHRLLTDALYREARRLLEAGLTTRIALRQAKAGVVRVSLSSAEDGGSQLSLVAGEAAPAAAGFN